MALAVPLPLSAAATAALRRLRDASPEREGPEPERSAPPRLACELCSEPLHEMHEHVLEMATGGLACVCTACALLFESPAAGRRRLPRDSRFLPRLQLSGAEWASLQIPVGLAFLTLNPGGAGATAAYPSPAGMVTSSVEIAVWRDLADAHPELQRVEAAVEALLVNRLTEPHRCFVVPLDQAFRLAGLVRRAWTGLSGGRRVQEAVAGFCAALTMDAGGSGEMHA